MNRMLIRNYCYIFVFIAIVFFTLNSCNTTPEPEYPATENEYIYETFKEWYLWNDQIPVIDPNAYTTQADLINAIKVDEDRWSFTGSYTQIMKLFESGEYTGFGAGVMLDADNQVKITQVYPNSPFGRYGVQRGWIVKSVNGYGSDDLINFNEAFASTDFVDFVLINSSGVEINAQIKKEVVNINTVLYSTIYEEGAHKIGYVVFDSFLEISKDELNTVFADFQQKNITDLIVDLRYNGGGLNTIAYQLIGIIGGNKVDGMVISKTIHNNQKSKYNSEEISQITAPWVNVEKVYFLTGTGTASASELVINALTPFMEVKLIGKTTHGKPVGMFVLSEKKFDLAILPICFKIVNSLDYGDYFNGLPVQINEIDDLAHNWGDTEEAMLKAALKDINEPTIASTHLYKSELINRQKAIEYTGLNQIINAW